MKKKLMFTFMIIFSMFFMMDNVFAREFVCEALPDVVFDEQVPVIIKTVILIFQISVPVLLVIMGSIDLFKGIYSQKEDEIKKGQQIFIKRLISGLLVFFVIAIVKFVISAVGSTSDPTIMSCVKWLIYGPDKGPLC